MIGLMYRLLVRIGCFQVGMLLFDMATSDIVEIR